MKRLLTLHWNKDQLNYVSSILGLLGTIVVLLGQYDYLPHKSANCIGAICGALVSFLVQQPATESPTTAEAEKNEA